MADGQGAASPRYPVPAFGAGTCLKRMKSAPPRRRPRPSIASRARRENFVLQRRSARPSFVAFSGREPMRFRDAARNLARRGRSLDRVGLFQITEPLAVPSRSRTELRGARCRLKVSKRSAGHPPSGKPQQANFRPGRLKAQVGPRAQQGPIIDEVGPNRVQREEARVDAAPSSTARSYCWSSPAKEKKKKQSLRFLARSANGKIEPRRRIMTAWSRGGGSMRCSPSIVRAALSRTAAFGVVLPKKNRKNRPG